MSQSSQHLALMPPRPGIVRRGIKSIQARWRRYSSLIGRAFSRIRSEPTAAAKFCEVVRLVKMAMAKIRRRAAVSAARGARTGSTWLGDYVAFPDQLPECRALGNGIFTVSLALASGENPDVSLRDAGGMFHAVRQIGRIVRAAPPASVPAHIGSGTAAEDRKAPDWHTVQLVLQAPAGLAGIDKADVHVRGVSPALTFKNVALRNSARIEIRKFSLDRNLVQFQGNARGRHELALGLFVDDHFSASALVRTRGTAFAGSFILDERHFDGTLHRLELRDLSHLGVLASIQEPLPLHQTPWNALQTHARAPLDGTLSPAARHHFRSFRLWLHSFAEQNRPLPPVSRLYNELLLGARNRTDHPRLEFPFAEHPRVSVVVPVHNNFEFTYLCLCSLLFAYNDASFEVIVVDDGSSDKTSNIASIVSGIRIVRHQTSLGFVDSCNDGAALARGEYLVFLNNDTEVTARWLDELILAFRGFDRVGLAGSKLIYPDGRLQEAGGIVWRSGDAWNVGRGGNAHDPRYNYLREVDYVSGAAMMLPASVWKEMGGFSAEFAPGYFEDTDLAMKVRAAGYRVVYVPGSTVIHFEGKSAGTTTSSGMKRFQEINRPKFQRKWASSLSTHGVYGEKPDLEKDRSARLRVLFLDHQFPQLDADAGSYAAFQEIRLFQSIGAKVTFLPRNLAWLDRHTLALQRIGVECLYAPYVNDYAQFLRTRAKDYDVVFVCRYRIAEHVIPLLRSYAPAARILFNLADLHFLREQREAEAGTPGYTKRGADATQAAELAIVQQSDLTFSYSDFEMELLERSLGGGVRIAKLPWVSEPQRFTRGFYDTRDLLFLGGFGHPPNAQAVKYFARKILPFVRTRLPDVRFDVVGRGAEDALEDCRHEGMRVVGHAPNLDTVMAQARIFVAPLLAGAGLKGKVIEAISRGVPCVLSPIAAEGTGLVHGQDCLIAESPEQWVDAILSLYLDESLWSALANGGLRLAETRYTFEQGARDFRSALTKIGIGQAPEGSSLVYGHVHPPHYGP